MITWLNALDPFPDTVHAWGADTDAPGLLAAGGDLSVARLTDAYRHGIFPWFSEGQPILWWTPDPRMVLPVDEFKLTRSLRKTIGKFLRTPGCEIRIDTAFDQVIEACANAPRHGQNGTWIVPAMQAAYKHWHAVGQVHSFETWVDGDLVGGLYGIGLGQMFYGESMFARQADASKIALAALVCFCRAHGITVIDCQQRTSHLASLGGRTWPRAEFEAHLRGGAYLKGPAVWAYDDSFWSHLDLAA
ncbi:leucyl/phenylalanyl-tRNA--protein transferase [Aquabacterium sp.]|uniref:leucyl/phenylalanyl-tRNA--protein transferase n=1 Tax=Aquabacterium sp. TaxID=1872578 RepID=UPI002486CFA9|nr:leucyl/phenylalanyl-tRNA--protein transferase [Aquabacterium sp.]MDI1260371.1 leucyl/phenylalanyl-tRNA--protein transferase [Aquabacterium sp.]